MGNVHLAILKGHVGRIDSWRDWDFVKVEIFEASVNGKLSKKDLKELEPLLKKKELMLKKRDVVKNRRVI